MQIALLGIYMKDILIKIYSLFNSTFDLRVKRIMNTGIKISFIAILFSVLIMSIYITTNQSYILFNVSMSLFKTFTTFISMFLINGIAFNKILKDSIH